MKKSKIMSDTDPIPSPRTRSTIQERNFRKIKTSFRDGILEEYGSVKFSEIKDEDPLLYAHSKRPKAILQAKALRHLDKTLGLAPQAYGEKDALNGKERRKLANRLTYENGVIGNRAVQECIQDLFIGYDVRRVSQELKLSRLRKANAQLEKHVNELRKKKIRCDSFREEKNGRMQICQSAVDASNQRVGQDPSMTQENFDREMTVGTGNSRGSSSILYQNTYPTERQSAFTASSDRAHEIKDQTMQSSAVPYEHHMAFSLQNQLSQQQRTYSFENQQAGVFQPHQLSQLQPAGQQGMPSFYNQEVSISRSQPYHPPLNLHRSPQGAVLPINQSPQYFFPQGQTSFVPGPNYNIQNYNGANQIVDLGRQNTFFQVMHPNWYSQTPVNFGQQMARDQNVNGDAGRTVMAGNPGLQNGQMQMAFPHWNAMTPIAYSDAVSPNFDLRP